MRPSALHAALRFLDSWLGYHARIDGICGFTVAIHHDDGIVLSRGYGFADVEASELMTPRHVFGVGSLSKMVASTAVCQLVRKGAVRLDDPVCDHLPWLASHSDPRFQQITIRQLLSHRSGMVREGADGNHWQLEKSFPDDRDVRHMLLSSELAVAPNTRPKYSNLGFALLGLLVQAGGNQSYVDHVTAQVLQPLRMEHSVADYVPDILQSLSAGYNRRMDGVRPRFDAGVATRAFAPVTGLHSTAEDMCLFAASHYWGEGALIGDALCKEAHRSQWVMTTGYDCGAEMGLGFQVITVGDQRLVGHTGSFCGHQSATFFEPEGRIAVSVLANTRDAPVAKMVRGIVGALHHFERHTTEDDNLAHFNVRVRSVLATVQVVAAGNSIVATEPDDWEPLAFAEELTVVGPETLRVTTPGSLFNEGELVRYTFGETGVQSVSYGGFTLLPDQAARSGPRFDPP